jgi:hypothetical protein
MKLSKVLLTIELLHAQHRPIGADQNVVERALAAHAKSALHVPLDAQLPRQVMFVAQAM